MTLARDGFKEMAISTIVLGGLAAAGGWAAVTVSPWYLLFAAPLAALWGFSILFFRVPNRSIPTGAGLLVSPADGRITEISRIENDGFIGRPALRIGIFLSVFDVHVNRSPCAGRVVSTQYCPGEFLDARHPECGIRNESNTLVIAPHEFTGPIVVRQVAGLIARRIICRVNPEDSVERGQLFGLIKFGSRTELIAPLDCGLEPAVRVGDHVKGGSSVLLMPAGRPIDTNMGTANRRPTAAGV
jgi:phosphatidylserine decarboxylase